MNITKSQKLLYTIIKELGGVDDKIKLAKYQYFSDFIHYAFNNEPISDVTNLYEKRPYGPLARSFNSDLAQLVTSGLIENNGKYHYSVKKELDNLLNKKEIKTIRYVINKYAKYSYDTLADLSHKQIPYLSTNEGGIIEYDTAYNLVDEYTDYNTCQ
ncbi:MAG: Panacea domain-containing protein [Candidatus Paceibacterota bacterium]|jgi:uncharacterized phage-associated protein